MKRQILFLLMMLLPLIANADKVQIDGIYYNLIPTAKIAEVTQGPIREDWDYETGDVNYVGYYKGDIVIPESVTYEGVKYSVTVISGGVDEVEYHICILGAFAYCTGLTSVTIPNSVTSIGEKAFYGCNSLTSVTIPNSVTSIGEGAFYECSGLTSVTIPNSVTSIGNFAFQVCNSLTAVHISDLAAWCKINFGYISNPLSYAHHLYINGEEIDKDLVVPNSVTSIGDYVFEGLSGLTSVNISNSVTSIGAGAFQGCSSLTSLTIPNSVTSISSYAFYECSGLTNISIPNTMTTIGFCAFQGCF